MGELHTTQEGGRCKADDVADHAAADGHDRDAAVSTGSDQRLVDTRCSLQSLRPLAVGNKNRLGVLQVG